MESCQGSEIANKRTVLLYLLVFRWLSLVYVLLFFLVQRPFFGSLNFAALFLAILYVLFFTVFHKIIYERVSKKPFLLGIDLLLCALFLIFGGWPKAWFLFSLTPLMAAALFWGYTQGFIFAAVICAVYLSTIRLSGALLQRQDLVRLDNLLFPTVGFLFGILAFTFFLGKRERNLKFIEGLEEKLAQKSVELDGAGSRFAGKIIEMVRGAIPVITLKDPAKILLVLTENARKLVGAEKAVSALLDRKRGKVEIDHSTLVVKGRKDQHLESWWKDELDEMARIIYETERHPERSKGEEVFGCLLRKSNKETSLICLPLKANDKYIGVLSVLNTYPYFFADDEINLLAALADQAAAAIAALRRSSGPPKTSNTQLEKELERITTKCLQSQEAERKRISRELHDNTAQSLTHLVIRMQKLNRSILPEQTELKNSISKLIAIAERTLEEVHEMAFQMRPAVLEDLGLVETINWYISHYLGTATLAVNFASAEKNVKFPPHVEIAVLRIVQEGLTNIRKYAKASEAFVNLELKDEELIVTIQDNGEGFDIEETLAKSTEKKSLGIMGMKERAELLGGSLEITSHLGEGTRIVANIPLKFKR